MKIHLKKTILFLKLFPATFGIYFLIAESCIGQDISCDSIPELNQQVLDFVKSKIRKKVGSGECWDLAAEALNKSGAKWNRKYIYGREIDYKNECVYPGDIIQFEGVLVKYIKDDVEFREKMMHHTAVVYEVKRKGIFTLAHQNTEFSGKRVGLSELNLLNITKGKIKIYRPVK